jgi:hypothetical protein
MGLTISSILSKFLRMKLTKIEPKKKTKRCLIDIASISTYSRSIHRPEDVHDTG